MDIQLPAELWLQIGGHLPRADLNRLVRTGHALHSLLLPLLHRAIILSGPDRFATDHAKRLQTIRDSLARIGAKFELVTAIRSCTFQRVEGTLLEEAIAFLGTLPNLSSLELTDLTLEADQLIRLSKSWRSPIEFVTWTVNVGPIDLPPSIIKETPPNLSSLVIIDAKCLYTSWRLFVQWSFSANLEILDLGAKLTPMLKALFEEHISSLPKVSFPRLKSLHLSALPGLENQGKIFDCMPMLENLDLRTFFNQPLNISETAIPRLRRYGGSGNIILSLVPRRPIHHLTLSCGLDLPDLWGSRTSPMLNFGSTSTIRYLYLPSTQNSLPSLQLITVACPSLYELQLTCDRRFRFSELEFVHKHIQHLYKLSELRRLDYSVFVHVPTHNSIGWERQICEALSVAAPNLTSVSLMPVITWNKSEVTREWKAGGIGLCALETRFPIGLAKWPAIPLPNRDP